MRHNPLRAVLVAGLTFGTTLVSGLPPRNAEASEITSDIEALASLYASLQTAARRGELSLFLPGGKDLQELLDQEGLGSDLEKQGSTLSFQENGPVLSFSDHRALRNSSRWAARELAELTRSVMGLDDEAEFVGADTLEADEFLRKTSTFGLAASPSGAALDSTILVRIQWHTPDTTNGHGIARKYRLFKHTDHLSGDPFAYESNFATAELVPIHFPGAPGSADSADIPLVVGKKYTFNLMSENGAGLSGPSKTAEDGRASLILDLRNTPPPPPPPPDGICPSGCRTGDADGNGQIDILDALLVIDYLYRNGPFPVYAVDVDSRTVEGYLNPDGYNVTLIDVVYLLNFIWLEGPEPAPCFGGECN